MFEVVNFDSWNVYDGASEGSGRSEKIWLISNSGEIGLFKFPKIDPQDQKETTEHISEHLAHQLGNILKVPTAKVDIGVRDGRIGSMSYLVPQKNEALVEGIDFVSGEYPSYNAYEFVDPIFAEDEVVERDFYVMGIRHHSACSGTNCMLLPSLKVGDMLVFEEEPNNKHDPMAIRVLTQTGDHLGYIPRYYNKAILARLHKGMTYSCEILEVNPSQSCSECIKVKLNIPSAKQ